MSVFKAYDIRGTWPDGIDAALSHRTGRAYADFIGKGPIAVGRDMRTMAPEAQVAAAITTMGSTVVQPWGAGKTMVRL